MKRISLSKAQIAALLFLCFTASCGRLFPLIGASDKLNELAQRMNDYCFGEEKATADITATLLEYKDLFDTVYDGEMTPQIKTEHLDMIDDGMELEVYPPDGGAEAGATVGLPLEATMDEILGVITHEDYTQVLLDPQRYYVYNREYTQGTKEEFNSGAIDYLVTRNYQEDVGQSGVSLKYWTDMTFRRFSKSVNELMPENGTVVVCNKMDGEAENNGVYNAYMTALYSFTIWYPIDAEKTYRINGTWIKAGGGLAFINLQANSGNVGKGILDETESIMNCINTDCYL